MTTKRVTLDEAVCTQLSAVRHAELCDASGRSVGYFLSGEVFYRVLYDWANSQITDTELERRRRQPGGRSLEEIWSRLVGS